MSVPLCAVAWCVASVVPGKTLCAIHDRFGRDYQPLAESARCDTCHGTRECDDCAGSGQCEHCACGTVHDCGMCDGTGHCPACDELPPPKLHPTEQDYIRWARSDGLKPWPPWFSGVVVRENVG